MTKIKLCGLSRACDIQAANELKPDYVGFVFAPNSKRYISPEMAAEFRKMLSPDIRTVGVFVDEEVERVADLLNQTIIDMAQLHGREDEGYIKRLKSLADKPVIKAFRITGVQSTASAESSPADYILLDSGAGTGRTFDWELIRHIKRPYFLAGGLEEGNVKDALTQLHPYAVDVSTGIETGGQKDKAKMAAFVAAVRKEDR